MSLNDFQRVPSMAEQLASFYDQLTPDEQQAMVQIVGRIDGSVDASRLASMPPEAILDPAEQQVVAALEAQPPTPAKLPPNVVLITKSTRLCNLRCTYCNSWDVGPGQTMRFETLARLIHGTLTDPGLRSARFVWHGGEPTLRGSAFYLKALWLQLRWRSPDQQVNNALQTNAVDLDDEFIELCRRFKIGLGVSLDGPPELHDSRRLDTTGRPTSERVHEGLARIRAAGIHAGVGMVVDQKTVQLGADRVLEYLLSLDVSSVGLMNVVPGIQEARQDGQGPWLRWDDWLRFLRDMFAAWWPHHADKLDIRELNALVRAMGGQESGFCHFEDDCFESVFTIDPDGSVSACDKYIGDPETDYGSIMDRPVGDVLTGAEVQARRQRDRDDDAELGDCRWSAVCNAGCPFDRDVNEAMGMRGPDGCCGLSPLLDDMAQMMAGTHPGPSDIDRVFPPTSDRTPSRPPSGVPVTITARSTVPADLAAGGV